VPHFRWLFGFYYVLRTTHDVVIARLPRCCKKFVRTAAAFAREMATLIARGRWIELRILGQGI
jgi:hypothetical protein